MPPHPASAGLAAGPRHAPTIIFTPSAASSANATQWSHAAIAAPTASPASQPSEHIATWNTPTSAANRTPSRALRSTAPRTTATAAASIASANASTTAASIAAARYGRSNRPAAPWPPPMHIVTTA